MLLVDEASTVIFDNVTLPVVILNEKKSQFCQYYFFSNKTLYNGEDHRKIAQFIIQQYLHENHITEKK